MTDPTNTEQMNRDHSAAIALWPNSDNCQLVPYADRSVCFLVMEYIPILDYRDVPIRTNDKAFVVVLDDLELPTVQHRIYLATNNFSHAAELAEESILSDRAVRVVSVGIDPLEVAFGKASLQDAIESAASASRYL